MKKECSLCMRSPNCPIIGSVCNQFELFSKYVQLVKDAQINKQTKNELRKYFMTVVNNYLLTNSNNNIAIFYSIDQNKYIIRIHKSKRSIGNWINLNINPTDFAQLRSVYNINYLEKVFDNFFNENCRIEPIEKPKLKLF